MAALEFHDWRGDPEGWARELGISREAVELYLAGDVIDLHIDSFIWPRAFGYDLRRRHGRGLLGGRIYGHVDFPRIREAALSGAVWIITTNPFRRAKRRPGVFFKNLERLQELFASVPQDFEVVRNVAEYRKVRASGRHAAFIGVQGGSAFEHDLNSLEQIPPGLILRCTVVHLSSSRLGETSAPGGKKDRGLTALGREFVERLNAQRIFVDLAHINRRGFFDAVEAHDKSQPLLVTHTGIQAVRRHWRNIDDEQIRAIADTGGTIGVMYQKDFLGSPARSVTAETIVDHLAHIIETAGDDHASLGSDWDGAIVPPPDLPTCLELPRLVEVMLRRGWDSERIQKILGRNFLRVVEAQRG